MDRAFDFLHVDEPESKPREKGITERVWEWPTDVAFEIANEGGVENCVFEAADPEVFVWYIKNFGPEVNLFVNVTAFDRERSASAAYSVF